MKIYDKDIYKKQENLRAAVVIIVVFLLGFLVGYIANSNSPSKNSMNQNSNNIVNSASSHV